MFFYTKHQAYLVRKFKCSSKAAHANFRFKHQISTIDVLNLIVRHNFRCLYCGDRLKAETWQLDHFYAKSAGGLNKIDNLAPSCKWCNMSKNALDGYAYVHMCKKVVENNLIYNINNIQPIDEDHENH